VTKFRALHSITPGHPEWRETPGVEATTGPLGQGTSNAVGYAMSQKMAAGKYNTAEHKIFDNKIFCLAGDGCMQATRSPHFMYSPYVTCSRFLTFCNQEGIAMEALAFAGHLKLDNLVLIYDSNDVTLDAMAAASQSENAALRFESIGFHVVWVQHGNDIAQIAAAIDLAKAFVGKPTIVILRTQIGKGIAEVAGTAKAHGEGGAKFILESKKKLGLPEGSHFFVSESTRAFFASRKAALQQKHASWTATFNAWKAANPALAAELAAGLHVVPDAAALFAKIPLFPADAKIATRKAGQDVLQPLSAAIPNSVSGSADLHGSTLNYIASSGDFGPTNATGRNIRFGIREHGMGGIANGINYDGLFRCSCATFLVFADYLRGSMRVAALSHVPTVLTLHLLLADLVHIEKCN
jgi:transketolase